MIPFSVLACLVSVVFLWTAGEARADEEIWSLPRCLAYAKANAPELLAKQKMVAQTKLDVEDADVCFLPDVGVMVGYNMAEVDSDRGFAGQLLVSDIFDGYKKFFEGRLSRIKHEISGLDLERTRAWLDLKVSHIYLDLLAGLKQTAMSRDLLALAEEKEEAVETLTQRGLAGPLEARQARLATLTQRLAVTELEGRNVVLTRQLKALIGLAEESPFAVDQDQSILDAVEEINPESKSNLDVAVADLKVKALDEQRKLLNLQQWPSPVIAAGWSEGTPAQSDGFYLLMGVNIPLFTAGRQQRLIKRQELEISRRQIDIARLKRSIDLRRSELEESISRLKLRLSLFQEAAGLAVDQSRLVATEFAQGRAGLADHVDARMEAKQRELEVLRAELDLSKTQVSRQALAKVVLK